MVSINNVNKFTGKRGKCEQKWELQHWNQAGWHSWSFYMAWVYFLIVSLAHFDFKIVNHTSVQRHMFTPQITIMCWETRIVLGEGGMFFFSFNLYRHIGTSNCSTKIVQWIPKLIYSYPPALLFSKQNDKLIFLLR